jgi:hypothetical protein
VAKSIHKRAVGRAAWQDTEDQLARLRSRLRDA